MPVAKPTSPIKSTTQNFIEIEEIKDDVVMMKDFSASIVIEVGAVNFWLLSQEDQVSMIYAYAGLLNSLSFPTQVLIVSKKMDISSYLDYVSHKINLQRNELMVKRMQSYREFIKSIVKKNTVLEKRFFFIFPFSPLELGISGANAHSLQKEYVISRAKVSLYPKRDHLLRLISRIGLRSTVMEKQGLTELFVNLYNPSATGRQLGPVDTYTDAVLTSN